MVSMRKIGSINYIHFLTFLCALTLNMGFSVTPKYIDILSIEKYWFGYFYSIMSVGHFVMSPIWGRISDKHGRKLVLCIGLLGYSIAQFLFISFSTGFELLFPRLMAGVFGNAVLVSTVTLVTDYTSVSQRTKGLSKYTGFFMLGTSAGYALSGFLGEPYRLGIINTFKFQSISALIMSIVILITLKNTKAKKVKIVEKVNFKEVLKEFDLSLLLLSLPLITISNFGVTKFLDFYISNNGYSTSQLGNFIGVTGIVTFLSTIFILPNLANKFKDKNLLGFATIMSGVFIIITFVQDNVLFSLYTTYMLYILFKAFYDPIHQSIISKKFKGNQGAILGFRRSFHALGSVLGPIILSLIYTPDSSIMFIWCGFTMVIVGIIVQICLRK